MTIPERYEFATEVKFYLRSYRAYFDVRFALEAYPSEAMTFSRWKVYWAGVCGLLKASIHMMKMDAKSCLPGPLRRELQAAYEQLGKAKDVYPIFWQFIDRERHNILKEYEFSAYEMYLRPDGSVETFWSILTSHDLQEVLLIRGGPFDGRNAIELAREATNWVGKYIEEAISAAGIDPNEKVTSTQFLRRQTGETDPPMNEDLRQLLASSPLYPTISSESSGDENGSNTRQAKKSDDTEG